MRFHVLTLFPEMVEQCLGSSIIGRAIDSKKIELDVVDIRDYSADEKHHKVDDYPYGGGAGMLMQAQPVYDAYLAVSKDCAKRPRTIYVTPQGRQFDQDLANELVKEEDLVFICGHYEGIDERVLEEVVTDQISIGDYVLTGGELPAMVMIDAISRLVPGVLHNDFSAETETFHQDLLEYPQYTRPEVWHDKKVPDVLLSGDHKKVLAWRNEKSVEKTKRLRPDLYEKYDRLQGIVARLMKNKRKYIHMIELIRRGRAECLYENDMTIALRDKKSGTIQLCAEDPDTVETLLSHPVVAEGIRKRQLFVVCQKWILDALLSYDHMKCSKTCYQGCYTLKNAMPVPYKNIRNVTMEYLDYCTENYYGERDYVKNRIEAGMLYGAFDKEDSTKIMGFMGIHNDGSTGMLFVDPAYRRMGIAESLEGYTLNKLIVEGLTPYGHVYESNMPSFKLQDKMGIIMCNEPMWWVYDDGEEENE